MTEYGHNWTGLICLLLFTVTVGPILLYAARREGLAKRRERDSKERFRRAVCLNIRKYPWMVRRLAIKFEVADSTVKRWANGVVAPLPRMRWVVMREMEEMLK